MEGFDVPRQGETLDAICGGHVRILQRERGYRFNLDPLLLVDFAAGPGLGDGPVLDLGTGTGIIPLLLARRYAVKRITGLELQPTLYGLARRNVRLNGCDDQVSLVLGDLRDAASLFPAGRFANVLSNPPYRTLRSGRHSPDPERATATSEQACTLREVVSAAEHLLGPGGAFHLVLPAGRLAELLSELRAQGLEPVRLRTVHPKPERAAHLVLVSAGKGAGAPLTVLPPLVLHDGGGARFSQEVERLLH